MIKQKPIAVSQGSKADKAKILCTYQRYIQLSAYLFKKGDNVIYNVTDIPEDNEFNKEAKEIASQLNIGWNRMTHANSNRIMLAMLEDLFRAMQDIEDSDSITVETKLIFSKNDKKQATK